jgi:hypothetical protein
MHNEESIAPGVSCNLVSMQVAVFTMLAARRGNIDYLIYIDCMKPGLYLHGRGFHHKAPSVGGQNAGW